MQDSLQNKSELPMFCRPLPGPLVKRQIISSVVSCMGRSPSARRILVTPRCSDTSSPGCSWGKTSFSQPLGGLIIYFFHPL